MDEEQQAIEDCLSSVALVRASMSGDVATGGDDMSFIMETMDEHDLKAALATTATLAGVILQSWHDAAKRVTPPEHHHEIPSADSMLDMMVHVLVGLNGKLPE